MRTLVLATTNRHKAAELQQMLSGLPLHLLTLGDLDAPPEVVEDADSFAGNALKKAHTLARATGHWALADDSGLVVDALGGAPGIHSARYAGLGATDAQNRLKLVDALRDLPGAPHTAHFVAALALVDATGREHVVTGRCDGHLTLDGRGAGGFGYDPLFIPLGHDHTLAELTPAEKDALSHRGQALRGLRPVLAAWLAADTSP